MILRILLCTAAVFAQASYAKYTEAPNVWSGITTPAAGAPQPIGSYSNGCQQGAQILPEHGEGYYDIRRFRNRFYSQPQTIALIQRIGRYVRQSTGEDILIGDLSQPIGGLMSYAHVSHQNGLDADIYFASVPAGTTPDKDREPAPVADLAQGQMLTQLWKPAYRNALYAAATDAATARIFVNPVIKQYLCRTEPNTAWLHKIRPWGGHYSHFHLRLNCPAGASLCADQRPIPAGDGCGADLDKWVWEQSDNILHPKPKKPSTPKPRPEPPASCVALLLQKQSQ